MKKELIVKSNALLETGYRLSTQEQRIVLHLASKINSDDEDFKDYTFSIQEFANLSGISLNSQYSRVKECTSSLLKRSFTINEPDGPLQVSWLSATKYYDGQGKITLRFDPGLKPYLLKLKNCFTKSSLSMVMQLKSCYSIRIYELLKQYENIGYREILLKDLKQNLGITENKYKLYGHFKTKVLKVAQQELSEKTNIKFDFEEIKIGRGVGKIRFIISSQKLPNSPIKANKTPTTCDKA